MSVTDDLLSNAESYAASFDKGDLPLPPARKVAVLACMDARLNPYWLLGIGHHRSALRATLGAWHRLPIHSLCVSDVTG